MSKETTTITVADCRDRVAFDLMKLIIMHNAAPEVVNSPNANGFLELFRDCRLATLGEDWHRGEETPALPETRDFEQYE